MKNNFTLKLALFLLLTFSIFHQPFSICTIRYVSHSGSSTPSYTTWETAADSIQKCINYSVDGDTIIVANGIYYESLIVNKYLWLWGSSMDSTIIDGSGLAGVTVDFQSDGYIQNFYIKGQGEGTLSTACIFTNLNNAFIYNCRLVNAYHGIAVVWSSSVADQCFITNVHQGFGTYCSADTCNSTIKNSIIITNDTQDATGVHIEGGGNTALNNIILTNPDNLYLWLGIGVYYHATTNMIKNNIVSGFKRGIEGYAIDTAIIHNNISANTSGTPVSYQRGFVIESTADMRNNISTNNEVGTEGPTTTNSDYNLYWKNNTNTTEGLAEHDIVADPMFVNDMIPTYGTYDFHLQMFSPAIDSGDPSILDVDGSRSDIGIYGGPGGSSYAYLNLPTRPPANLSANVENGFIILTWNHNSEADTAYYNVYRDTSANFTIDSTKLVGSPTDTFYIEPTPKEILKLYYKVTCVDTKGNESEPSEEAVIILTVGTDEWKPINNYMLYQNYPNPFNPSTKIGYKLISRAYVKLLVYDITGSLVSVLVNEVQEAGYYEVNFDAGYSMLDTGHKSKGLASGIYLYRLEVIGEGNIPKFSEMKKMILIK